MRLEQFAMERMQSTYENQVAFNLSESGVHPLRLGELIDDAAAREALLGEGLRYTQSNGTVALRELVAAMYPGATPDHVQVTNGGAEANYITTWHLVEPGDEVVMMVPNYMQTRGLARAFGAVVKEWPLVQPASAGEDNDRLRRGKPDSAGEDNDRLRRGKPDSAGEDNDRLRRGKPDSAGEDNDRLRRGKPDSAGEDNDRLRRGKPDSAGEDNDRLRRGKPDSAGEDNDRLRRGTHWRVDLDALERLVTARTKLIIVCNPNNPTGARFDEPDLDRIAAIASTHGSWILSDEIYRGAERDGRETASMWGRSDRVIVTSGLSKAYALPGLRIGWIVGPPALVATLWSYHDYTTISPGALSDALARRALEPERRARILARTRRILNQNFPVIEQWLDSHGGLFSYVAPDAGAIVYVRYHHDMNSTELVTRLRREKSVLIVPGDHFGMDGYLRIGFGDETDYLRQGLERLHDLIEEVRLQPGATHGQNVAAHEPQQTR